MINARPLGAVGLINGISLSYKKWRERGRGVEEGKHIARWGQGVRRVKWKAKQNTVPFCLQLATGLKHFLWPTQCDSGLSVYLDHG